MKRYLVNNDVWTADGGQFAETISTLDSYSEAQPVQYMDGSLMTWTGH